MNRPTQVFTLALTATAVVALIATFKTPPLSAQNSGPNVTLASPLPLPVTGSVSVTSLPAIDIGPLPAPALPDVYQKTLTRAQYSDRAVLFENSEFQIPEGKAVVIEHASATAQTAAVETDVVAILTCNAAGQSAEHYLTFQRVGVLTPGNNQTNAASAPLRCYATSLTAKVQHAVGTTPFAVGVPVVSLSLSGYLVDIP